MYNTRDLLFQLHGFSVDSARFEENEISSNIVSTFVSPVDSYRHLYIESSYLPSVVSFISRLHYTTNSLTVIPVEDRQVLLTVRHEDRSWVRLKDGSVGYAVAYNHTAPQANMWIAAPPRLRPIENPSGAPIRRLYTLEDMNKLISKSRFNHLASRPPATHIIVTKSNTILSFCGPLELKSIRLSSCAPVAIPNPFELLTFFEANATWPSLLTSMSNHGISTTGVREFDIFKFLTLPYIQRIGHRYAAEFLKVGDRVRLSWSPRDTPSDVIGTIRSLHDENVLVFFPTTSHTELTPRDQTIQVFQPLDLVEAHCGQHHGLRGMVILIEDDQVYVQNENDVTSLVRHVF